MSEEHASETVVTGKIWLRCYKPASFNAFADRRLRVAGSLLVTDFSTQNGAGEEKPKVIGKTSKSVFLIVKRVFAKRKYA